MEISYAKIQTKHIFEFFGVKPSLFYFISEIYAFPLLTKKSRRLIFLENTPSMLTE